MHDLIIENGTIIDGSGDEQYVADLAINDGVITEIGDLRGEHAQKHVDASDHYVVPGFVDLSNRSDVYWRLFRDPLMESLLRQGITTMICGNSGSSLAPIYNKDMLLSLQKWSDIRKINVGWETMREFLDAVEALHLSMNFATFVGHGTLRRGLTGDTMRALKPKEMHALQKHITQSLTEGAFGVSLGLVYTHEQKTTAEELTMIAQTIEKQRGLFVAHLRNEDRDVLEALDEILSVARLTNVRTHITHLKAVGSKNWSLMSQALEAIEQMRANGFNVLFDLYPYNYTGSVLYTFLPEWVTDGGRAMMLGRLRTPQIYQHVVKELRDVDVDFGTAIVAHGISDNNIRGKKIATLAQAQNKTVEELVLDLLIASEGRVIVLIDALSEENLIRGISNPYSIVTTNAPGYSLTNIDAHATVHPRSFGSFPRLLHRYVNQQKILSWEEAIYKISGKPAQHVGLDRRGLLRQGYYADIVVIDPMRVEDCATIQKPLQYARGIRDVFVNGIPVIESARLTGIRPGHVLRKTSV